MQDNLRTVICSEADEGCELFPAPTQTYKHKKYAVKKILLLITWDRFELSHSYVHRRLRRALIGEVDMINTPRDYHSFLRLSRLGYPADLPSVH